MGRGNPIPTAVRTTVDQRDNRQCLRCGSRSRELHHRQRRREGGHALSCVISLCGSCHRWVHANPAESRETGYIVSVYADGLAEIPIDTFYGRVLLTDTGSIRWQHQPRSAPLTS